MSERPGRSPEQLRDLAAALSRRAETSKAEDAAKLRQLAAGFRLVAKLKERRGNDDARREALRTIYEQAASRFDIRKEQLAHRHMMALADTFEGWAMSRDVDRAGTARLVGWAEALRRMAADVGSDWNPPEPDTLGIFGFLGRAVLNEAVDPDATPRGKRSRGR